MQKINNYLIKCFAESFKVKGQILEIGSYVVTGQEKLMDIRKYFSNCNYIGVDFREGPGVDVIADVTNLQFKDNTFDLVICLDTFEHVDNAYKASEEIYRVLKPKGILVLSSVMNFQIHDYPYDYWRFTPKAFDYLFKSFSIRNIFTYGKNRLFPQNVYIIAVKNNLNKSESKKLIDKFAKFKKFFSTYKHNPFKQLIYNLHSSIQDLVLPNKTYWENLNKKK